MLCRPASECTDLKVSAVCNFYCAAQKIVKKQMRLTCNEIVNIKQEILSAAFQVLSTTLKFDIHVVRLELSTKSIG